MINNNIKTVRPPNFGWLEKKLSEVEVNYLWKCIDNSKESAKMHLAGNISESNDLIDDDDWFFNNTILPLCEIYAVEFANVGYSIPVNQTHPYQLNQFWVNYQKQNEFNPIHNHTGIYSFVIWLKIPTRHFDQNQNPISHRSNSPRISAFEFEYIDLVGSTTSYIYEMNPEIEGTLVFFPSKLRHQVYPFYNCNEDRVSISGNIFLNTKYYYENSTF